MSTRRQSAEVKRGNSHVTVYPWTHPKTGALRWRFAWRAKQSDPWRYETHKTKAAAIDAADNRLAAIESGTIEWEALSPRRRLFLRTVHDETSEADEAAVLAYLASRNRSADVQAAVAQFLAERRAGKPIETRHLGNVRRIIEPFAAHFAGRRVADLTDADVLAWWQARCDGCGLKTRNEVRGALVQFFNWAIVARMLAKDTTAADRLPRSEPLKHERRVLSPDELLAVLAEVQPEWRAWVVLGAFAGMRPEEIAPATVGAARTRADKRGLLCEEIDWQFGVIRIPEEASKVGHARNVPLNDACRAWLIWAEITPGAVGPVCLRNPARRPFETARLGKAVFGGAWPQDVLRHSYGSYRNAQLRNLNQVAEEMGTSVGMLQRHYHNPRTVEEGEAWFALRPPGTGAASKPPRRRRA